MKLWDFCCNDKILQTPDNINYCDVAEVEWMRFAGELYMARTWRQDGHMLMFLGIYRQEQFLEFIDLNTHERISLRIENFHRYCFPVEWPVETTEGVVNSTSGNEIIGDSEP